MFCERCGNRLDPATNKCFNCGFVLAEETPTDNPTQIQQPVMQVPPQPQTPPMPQYTPPMQAQPPQKPKKGSNKAVLWLIIILLILALLGAGVYAVYQMDIIEGFGPSASYGYDDDDDDDNDKDDEKDDTEKDDKDDKDDKDGKDSKSGKSSAAKNSNDDIELEKELNEYISDNFAERTDVTVCVIDNKTGEIYKSRGANKQYVAWGFYLPIYLALDAEYPNDYADTKADIMSSNIALCNTAANNGIDYLGGLDSLNEVISDNFKVKKTSFGRKFGASSIYGDNYTSAEDAAKLLKELDDKGKHDLLQYNIAAQGINYSKDLSVYAHTGTDNANVKSTYNVFAIAKGTKADFSIAIMTVNQTNAVQTVSDILEIAEDELS
ncbi:MAG: hypothetical protein J6D26_04160 [Clostridia bacterium]|nr:hypothetical protein [Clostridia bacterium]